MEKQKTTNWQACTFDTDDYIEKGYDNGDYTVICDGEEKDWLDGKILCNNLLGYGMDFSID